MIHHVLEPLTSRGGRGRRTVVKTEEKVAPDVVLRRTTIDEIEVRREDT